ncbi:MAG: TonB-dependent receptor [Bacteroidota bacterium]
MLRSIKIAFLFSFLFSLVAKLSYAQLPDSLSMQVDTIGDSSTYDPSISESTASRTVITAAEIMERGYDNMDELLSSVQGLYITHDQTFTQIGIRGVSPTDGNNQRVQVLLDGIPLNNPLSGEAPSGYDLRGVAMEDIEEVVIIRSAAPALYGNNAMLGVIKINTKKARKGGRINFDTGSFGELDGGFALGYSFGKVNLGFSGRLASIDGPELYIPLDSVFNQESVDFGGFRMRLNVGKFSVNATYNRRSENIASVPAEPVYLGFLVFNDSISSDTANYFKQIVDEQGDFDERQLYVDLNFKSNLGKKQFMDIRLFMNYERSEQQLFYRDIETDLDSFSFDPDIPYVEYFDNLEEVNLLTGLAYQHGYQFSPKHQLMAGTQILLSPISRYEQNNELVRHWDGDDFITMNYWPEVLEYMEDKAEEYTNYDEKLAYWSAAFFTREYIQLIPSITLSAGLRVEINSQTQPVFAPDLSLILAPFSNKEGTKIRLAFNQGYRLPGLLETDIPQVDRAAPNSDLEAEKSTNYELGLQQKIGKGLDLNLSFFHQELDNIIGNEENRFQNWQDSALTNTGLEGGLGLHLRQGIKTYFNYNFQFDRDGNFNMPSPLCKFGVTIPFLRHFSIFTEGIYEGNRRTISGRTSLPYFLLNANLLLRPRIEETHRFARWINQSSLTFRLFNALDQFYQHPVAAQRVSSGLIPQNGRTWQTQLTIQF